MRPPASEVRPHKTLKGTNSRVPRRAEETPHSKPVLRWAGSKRLMVSKLLALAPTSFRRYIEPFCGSACLYLAIRPNDAILADLNSHLIGTYACLQSEAKAVANALRRWSPTREAYLRARQLEPQAQSAEAAARFLFLNRFSFNGVYRENLQGQFNVPFGGQRAGKLPSQSDLVRFGDALKAARLICADFEKVVALSEENDFLYLDPPYHYGKTRNRGEYGLGAFTSDDLDRLVQALRSADQRGSKVLLSYNKAHQLQRHLTDWKLTYTTVRRSVAGFSSSRSNIREYQLRNY